MYKNFIIISLIFISIILPMLSHASEQTWEKEYKAYSDNKNYTAALNILSKAENDDPDNNEIKLAKARVYSWKGEYEKAEDILTSYTKKYPDDVDAQFLLGNLRYYQSRLNESKEILLQIINSHPEYTDAKISLERVEKALNKPNNNWQIDMGYEISNFSRHKQSGWDQEFMQLNRFFNDKNTNIHAKITRYNQFNNVDSEYEVGVNNKFYDFLKGYLYINTSQEPNFRPQYKFMTGGEFRILDENNLLPVWFSLDSSFDKYKNTIIKNLNPGIIVEASDKLELHGRLITVNQQNSNTLYGWDSRLNAGISDRFSIFTGYSHAPDTVSGQTVKTRTYFGGFAINVRPDIILRLGYTHDDRENSYIRQVYDSSISYIF